MDYFSRASKPVRPAEGGIKSTYQSFLGKGGAKKIETSVPWVKRARNQWQFCLA